jgi:lipopolysaccharide/colanic/teichoic acid biosynthesis glycosyltransferase
MNKTFYLSWGKRALDIAMSFLGLVLLLPLLLLVAFVVKFSDSGPALFRQTRVGQGGRLFTIFKFRTMVDGNGNPGLQVTRGGDPRITRIGALLRKTKIDELPQLLNVLRGEMSLVGPRPEVERYTATYSEEHKAVLKQKPGITSPSSCASILEEELLRNQADPETFYIEAVLPAKLEADFCYCRNVSLRGDINILLQTVAKLIWQILGRSSSLPQTSVKHL